VVAESWRDVIVELLKDRNEDAAMAVIDTFMESGRAYGYEYWLPKLFDVLDQKPELPQWLLLEISERARARFEAQEDADLDSVDTVLDTEGAQ